MVTVMEYLTIAKLSIPILLLALFWGWETWWPFFGEQKERYRHAGYNLTLALVNTLILGIVVGSLTTLVAQWTQEKQLGLFHYFGIPTPIQFALALVILDGWMYCWHRANHAIPLLWRFHRMHHSDRHMDVTTATRFHLGEHMGASLLRLGFIPLFGFTIWHLVVYEIVVIAITQFHHADISLGCWDWWLRLVIVTPDMHKLHHSDKQSETDSNYSTLLSIWDRLACTLQRRSDLKDIHFGLTEFTDPSWQTWNGMWKTPFVDPVSKSSERISQDSSQRKSGPSKEILDS